MYLYLENVPRFSLWVLSPIHMQVQQDWKTSCPSYNPPSAPESVKKARNGSLAVKGAQLFNLLPINLRNSDHGDVPMFKNHLDIFLADIPDQPTVSGLGRAAETNSLLHQIPISRLLN